MVIMADLRRYFLVFSMAILCDSLDTELGSL